MERRDRRAPATDASRGPPAHPQTPAAPGARVVRVAAVLGPALAGWYAGDRRRGQHESRAGLSRRLRRAFERLGPTYIKLGQILSSGEGLFPEELVAEFRLLRDRVPAEPFAVVRRIVESDLGMPLEQQFSSFDRIPIAAASVAQVHARPPQTGRGRGEGAAARRRRRSSAATSPP